MKQTTQQLIQRYRFQIDQHISNTKLRKLSQFYKIIYLKNDKERTVENLQIILDHHNKKNKEYKIQQKNECIICYEILTESMLITRCNHAFCDNCIINYLNLYNELCPICRNPCQISMFIEDKQLSQQRLQEWSDRDILQNPIQEYIDNELPEYSPFIYSFLSKIRANHLIFIGIFILIVIYIISDYIYLHKYTALYLIYEFIK
jgi:hypothetical protein